MKKKLILSLLATTMAATSLVGCGSGSGKTPAATDTTGTTASASPEASQSASGEKTVVTMWIMPNSGEAEADFMEILKPFLEANPDIDVQPTLLDWGSAWAKLTTAATSGEGPDITQLGTTQIAAIAAMGALEDLTPVYEKFGGEEAFVAATLPTTQILGAGEERYAAPWFIDTRALFYRKDLCEAAGVDPTKDFETWDSFKAALTKLKDVEVGGVKVPALGMPGKNDWNVIHNYAPWIYGAGGDFIGPDNKTSVINSKEAFEGVKFYTELAVEGLMSMPALEKNSSEIEALFNAGEFATMFSGAYEIATLRKEQPELAEKVGTAVIPGGPQGRYAFFGGSGLSVFKNSKNKEAAYRVLEFLMTPEAQIACQEKCGNLPAVNAAFETSFVTDEEMRVAFKDQLQYGKAYPSVAGWGPSETLLQKGLSNVWDNVMGVFGAYDPAKSQEFLDQTANECTTIYSQQ